MSVIIFGFLVGFFGPLREIESPAIIFRFYDDSAVVGVADVGDVPAILSPGFYSSVYAVVEVVPEKICNLSFKFGSGLFGCFSCSAQNGGSCRFLGLGLCFWTDCPRVGCLSVCGAAGRGFGRVSGLWSQRLAGLVPFTHPFSSHWLQLLIAWRRCLRSSAFAVSCRSS